MSVRAALAVALAVACGGADPKGTGPDDTAPPTSPATGATPAGTTTPAGTGSPTGTTSPGPTGDTATLGCGPLAAVVTTSAARGRLPLTATLDIAASCLPDAIDAVRWDFGDGSPPAEGERVDHTWLGSGTFEVTVTVTDVAGAEDVAVTTVEVLAGACPTAAGFTTAGNLAHPDLDEASGLAVSRRAPDLLWTHNDDDDGARLFALGADGRDRGVFVLADAEVADWEDIAIDDGSGQSTLYVGDLGDNSHRRDFVAVYVVPEPDPALLDGDPQDVAWEVLTLEYPTEVPLNGDSLAVDPQTGDLVIIARTADDTTEVYRKPAPHVDGEHVVLEHVATLALGSPQLPGSDQATGASFSPLGDRLLVRTWDSAFVFLRDATAPLAAAFEAPCPVGVPVEPRGEAIAFDADGAGFYTVSEELFQPVWRTDLVEPPPPCDGLEARIVMTPPGGPLPLTVHFAADPDCVPAGIAEVAWEIDGEAIDELEPERTWLRSGDVPVAMTVWDATGASVSTATVLTVAPGVCPAPGPRESWGDLEHDAIDEASGLVHSAASPGVLWTHNDAGNPAELFAFAEDGQHLGVWTLDGAPSRDWEDLSAGWDATLGTYVLYVGDVGDNGRTRDEIRVLVVPEPVVPPPGEPLSERVEDWHELVLTYPDGESYNCETLLTDPVTGDLYIVTKDYGGDTDIYVKRAPHVADSATELEWVAHRTFGEPPLDGHAATTGGEFSPLGDRILIRTYTSAYVFLRDQASTVAAAFEGVACDVDGPPEFQGEAAAFTTDGRGYLTVSEREHEPIWYTPLE